MGRRSQEILGLSTSVNCPFLFVFRMAEPRCRVKTDENPGIMISCLLFYLMSSFQNKFFSRVAEGFKTDWVEEKNVFSDGYLSRTFSFRLGPQPQAANELTEVASQTRVFSFCQRYNCIIITAYGLQTSTSYTSYSISNAVAQGTTKGET